MPLIGRRKEEGVRQREGVEENKVGDLPFTLAGARGVVFAKLIIAFCPFPFIIQTERGGKQVEMALKKQYRYVRRFA